MAHHIDPALARLEPAPPALSGSSNITEQTFYRWRRKYGGLEVSGAKKLKDLERENSELTRMVAEQALDIRMLKDLNSENYMLQFRAP
jgi:putative transposase